MQFCETALIGAWLVDQEPHRDQRGFFARTFCAREFGEKGLETNFVQHSVSGTLLRGTLRGMHFQRTPHKEVKVVTCVKGSIHDVIVDLRPGSATYGRWQAFDLTAGNRRRLYIPKGFAHGFQALSDNAEVGYLISTFYEPGSAAGIRYDDPAFRIHWPLPVAVISEKDRTWPDYVPERAF